MSDQKTLVIISPGFPADENDSTCLPTQQLLVKYINQVFPGIRVVILALQYPYRNEPFTWNGNKVIPLNSKKTPKIFRPLLLWKATRLLKQIDRETKISAVLTFWCGETSLIGKRFAKRNSIPFKIWISGQDARKNPLVSWIAPSADDLVAMSDFLADEFFKNHKLRPAHTVFNAIESPAQSHFAKDLDVLGAGSLIRLKRYDSFVRVVKAISNKRGINAELVGNGPEEINLEKLIKENLLGQVMTMTGELSHEELLKKMERSKIFIHPSSYEGYSTVCLEALSRGCHVISFTHAEHKPIDHWHIVRDEEEMIEKALELLSKSIDHKSIVVHLMEDTASQMIKLLDLV